MTFSAAAESSAHRAGKPDDSNPPLSKLTDRSASSVIRFEVEAALCAGDTHKRAHTKMHIHT